VSASADLRPLDAWTLAVRPRTLPASLAPVIVGSAAAYADGGFSPWLALAALACSMLLQVSVNLANDYFDTRGGHDLTYRQGPPLGMQTGLIPAARMKGAMALTGALCILSGTPLVLAGGLPILLIGAASILITFAYSAGPFPLGSHCLGELVVFLFFGLVGVCGTYYVQTLGLTWLPVVSAVPVGLLITAILVVNNIRDVRSDAHIGKKTLAVMLGDRRSRQAYAILVTLPYLFPFVLLAINGLSPWALLPLVTFPNAARAIRLVVNESGPTLNQGLALTAKLALLYSLFLSAGIILTSN